MPETTNPTDGCLVSEEFVHCHGCCGYGTVATVRYSRTGTVLSQSEQRTTCPVCLGSGGWLVRKLVRMENGSTSCT